MSLIQPRNFRKSGLEYEVTTELCELPDCNMLLYQAVYQGKIWRACYFCRVKRYIKDIDQTGIILWSNYMDIV